MDQCHYYTFMFMTFVVFYGSYQPVIDLLTLILALWIQIPTKASSISGYHNREVVLSIVYRRFLRSFAQWSCIYYSRSAGIGIPTFLSREALKTNASTHILDILLHSANSSQFSSLYTDSANVFIQNI